MAKQFKLVQVVGKKIDPNAKYMFMVDGRTPYNQVEHFVKEMSRLLGKDNFAVTLTNGDPKKTIQIMEIQPEYQVQTVSEKYIYNDLPESIARSLDRTDEDCVDCEEKRKQQAIRFDPNNPNYALNNPELSDRSPNEA